MLRDQLFRSLAGCVVGAMVCAAAAAQTDQQSEKDGRTGTRNNSSGEDENTSKEQGKSASAQKWQVTPQGWVRIAYDFDRDGRTDAVEEIYSLDLERARNSSKQRKQKERSDGSEPRQTQHIRGTIQELNSVSLVGQGSPHVLARIRTSGGRTEKIDLGPRSQLSRLNLQQGDEVSASAVRGRINDRSMLLATRVESQGQTVTVNRAGQQLSRIRGEVVATRVANFQNRSGSYLLAKIRLQNGRVEVVNLGPTQEVRRADVRSGDRLNLLVRAGRINGEQAFFAEQFRSDDGELIRVNMQERGRSYRLQGTPIFGLGDEEQNSSSNRSTQN